jgi:hypothetical protein
VAAGERHDSPAGAVEEVNGPTTPGTPGGSRRLHAHRPSRRNAWQPPGCLARVIESEADTHNHIADGAGNTVCVDHETASTPFVLALRAPGAAC